MKYAIIGFIIGLALQRFIIKPIERKRIREELIRDGIVPREMAGGKAVLRDE